MVGMHSRGVGAGTIAKKKLSEAKYQERGTVFAKDQLAQMSKQLDMFKTNLEEFASKHKQEMRKNPEFRVQFPDMCATIGVLKGRGKFAQDVSQDDLIRAIKKLKALGTGFCIIPVGGTYLVQSVPAELNMHHTVVLQLAEKNGYVTVSEIKASLKWETKRVWQVLEHLLKEGLVWLDLQAPGEAQYWLPALFTDLYSQEITAEEAREVLP
ncbi:ESCRT-II subunit protein snf8 [Saguinus oedipus]|uniref:Vacuolar-sorting protein SNF8 n=1 Tax=Saguinus oedipus TaxID=9490 RepID=A0ABQ9UBX6_SAGOE|nr:ESCRT-II subunit protein snf8 [Saguinus oedipus]